MAGAKPRLLGSNVTLFLEVDNAVLGAVSTFKTQIQGVTDLGLPIGEFESMKAASNMRIQKRQPIGTSKQQATLSHGGWDIELSGAKSGTNGYFRDIFYSVVESAVKSGTEMKFRLSERMEYDDGKVITYIYRPLWIHNMEVIVAAQNEFVQQPLRAFASNRELLGIDLDQYAPQVAALGSAAFLVIQALIPGNGK